MVLMVHNVDLPVIDRLGLYCSVDTLGIRYVHLGPCKIEIGLFEI